MKILILILILLFIFTRLASAQEFVMVKNSINDINKQGQFFIDHKIKKIIIDNYEEYNISGNGKITSVLNNYGPNSILTEYLYINSNLVMRNTLNSNDNFNEIYFYDSYGNVEKYKNSDFEILYYYDSDNNLIKTIVGESSEACDMPIPGDFREMNYTNGFLSEIRTNCSDDGIENKMYITRYTYDNDQRLTRISEYILNCRNKKEVLDETSTYAYNSESQLPYEINTEGSNGNYLTKISYEYYK
ncbi:hypothetical protein BH10BAC5_BH10BAC5_25660 [soil metagenome]